MYLLGELPARAEHLIDQLQELPERLLQGVAADAEALRLAPGSELGAQLADDRVYHIVAGQVQVEIEGRTLFYLAEGDLLGLQGPAEWPDLRLSSQAEVTLQGYPRQALFEHLAQTAEGQALLLRYLTGQTRLLAAALAELKQPEARLSTGHRHFAKGETLIQQGEAAGEVFIIVEGAAEAWVDGHKVGDIGTDEIFGAMAVFTGEPRSASVIAREPCSVMMIPKEQFLDLMHGNPRIAQGLLEGMARRIQALNGEVTQLREGVH